MANLYDIIKKYPFIYEIKDKLFHIGMGRFDLCTNQTAIENYQKYKEEIEKIGRDRLDEERIEKEEFYELAELFGSLKEYSDESIDSKELSEIHGRIITFIDELAADEQDSLLVQIEDYIRVFKYFNMYSASWNT